VHGNSQRELVGLHAQWAQSLLLLEEPLGANDTRRARRTLRVDLDVPFGELTIQVFIVDEASLFEERALDPPDEILDGALLLGTARPAQLDGETEIERDASEDGIPLDDRAVLVPRRRDGLRPVKDRE
jgi:hypothetical protein